MDLHTGYSVRITPDGGTATLLNGVTQQSVRTGSEHAAEATAGNAYANTGSINRIQPAATFSCLDVAEVIDLLGLRGACLAGGSSPGAEFYELALDACGTVKALTSHRRNILPNGLALIRRISCGHRQNASVDVEVLTHYDGTNNPLIPEDSVAAPTGLAAPTLFTLGPVSLNGVEFTGNLQVDIDFAIEAETDGGDSDVYDTSIVIAQIIPKFTIRGREVAKFATASGIPLEGAKGTHANTSIILRKRTPRTASFSDNADNIEITGDAMISVDEAWSAQANRRGEIGLMGTCLDDGTNAPLVFDTSYDPTPV